jgi:hypothetical protein
MNRIHQVLAPVGWVWRLKIEQEIQIGEALGAPARGNRDPGAGDLGEEEQTGAEHSSGVNTKMAQVEKIWMSEIVKPKWQIDREN